jgi:hypothetical protein
MMLRQPISSWLRFRASSKLLFGLEMGIWFELYDFSTNELYLVDWSFNEVEVCPSSELEKKAILSKSSGFFSLVRFLLIFTEMSFY